VRIHKEILFPVNCAISYVAFDTVYFVTFCVCFLRVKQFVEITMHARSRSAEHFHCQHAL